MEEVRQLVQEEGREARNLVAFHVAVDTPASTTTAARVATRKPPRVTTVRRAPPRSAARLRSASAGRDKREELRARYWALLFGDLQRAIGEIYNTVEAHENQNECQEVILVLENYTRDFKALGEWFRLKWEYDNTPPPQRPQSLAWEIRKTDFVRPESRRAYSVKSSPSVSGKNSPCLSGHNTPSGKNSPVTGKNSPGSGKISPRVTQYASTSPKANVEFFSNKIASKIATKPEAKVAKETRLSDIKEKEVKENCEDNVVKKDANVKLDEQQPAIELGKAKECPNISPNKVVIKSPKHAQSEDKNVDEISIQAKATAAKLDAMENEFLVQHLAENKAKNENILNQDKEIEKAIEEIAKVESNHIGEDSKETNVKDANEAQSPVKSADDFADVSDDSYPNNDTKPDETKPKESIPTKDEIIQDISNVDLVKDNSLVNGPVNEPSDASEKEDQDAKKVDPKGPKPADCKQVDIKPARPAYSQAAAKPKAVTAKPEVKPPIRATTPILRSRTIVEIPNNAPKTRQQFPKRNQTSKCSYPFNLTTGRTSLFDSKPSAKVANKNTIARPGLASGDNKILPHAQLKVDPKKRQPRPTSLKSSEIGDKKEKSTLTLEKIKDCDEYSSCDTLVTQIDMSRIESSESLKTLVPEEMQTIPDMANSIEVLNVQSAKCDEEWLTVKSKRLSRESKKQSKNHWGNRFHQPSATTSLPTLNMLESPKQETNPIIQANNAKLDRAKSEQPEKPKPPKTKVAKPKEKFKDPAMIRQKSDVTGLKTRSSRNKVTKKSKESKQNGELSKNRLHSSLESLTGLARSQESTEDTFDFDKWKAEFKSTFKCFDDDDQIAEHDEILKAADPSEMSEIAEMTSQIEENERKMSLALDFQSDADQRKLCAEEDLLNRQIMELQQVSDIDMDTETDDTETDAEILCEDTNLPPTCQSPENLGALAASLEDQYETALAGMSWAERVDTLVVLEALVARDPGRAQQLHAKLSQGIKRRGSLQDALRRLQAKQARAEKQRIEYQTERAKRIHQLLARVEEVKVAKNQLIEEKRLRLERRLQKAAENRDQHIKCIVRKAHDEEEKLREIAFIKQLEAENRRHDFLDQCRSHTTRLRQMRREQLGKLEQKAAREAAVGARRQAIEAARKLHVETLLEKRKERDARVEELKEQKKQERDDAAREKAEGVKSRLSALAAAAELEADALRSRIRDKQDASQMRLESHLQHIREKATGPRQATTSESQDEKKGEEEEAERIEQEKKEREKQKAVKKRARKVKQKLLTTGCEAAFSDENMPMETVFPTSNKMYKVIQQLAQILNPLLVIDNTEKPKFEVNNPTNGIEDDINKQNKKNNNNSPTNVIDDEINKQNKKNKNNSLTNVIDDEINKQNKKNKTNNPTNSIDEEINKQNKKNKNNSPTNVIDEEVNKQNKKTKNNSPTNSIDDEINKQNKKNKNKDNNNKIVNGNENGKSKKLKKQKSDEKPETEVIENNNNNANSEIIIETQEEANINGETAKKKAKKNKIVKEIDAKANERPKLSKTSSVCSSLSDMSKTSCKSEKKTRVVIDTAYFDRQLNELHRMMEKFDKLTRPLPQRSLLDIAKDKCLAQKLQGLKILAQLLAVASEREDLAPQFSAKTLTTAVMIMSRVIGNCAMSAGYFITTNACVHCVKLLAGRLDKDLTSDPKELELAKQLADCLSIALDSVLCSTRLYEESKDSRDGDLLSALRGRSHTLISYLCLCGCVTKAERPEAGDARESVHTLLTVCSDLCHPCDADIGSERASATQSLRCALGTSVCGARGEFCMLFARDVEIEQCDGFVRAARTAHLLRAVAELDHHIVQEAFGEGGWPLEFRAAVSRLLSQHAPNDRESPRTSVQRIGNQRLDQTLQETLVLDLIVLVGFVVVNNPQLQETICDGWSVIKTLCNLPANWLVSKPHSHALLPTLVALSERPSVNAAISSELSTQMLDEYMQNPDAQKVKLVQVIKQGQAKKSAAKK